MCFSIKKQKTGISLVLSVAHLSVSRWGRSAGGVEREVWVCRLLRACLESIVSDGEPAWGRMKGTPRGRRGWGRLLGERARLGLDFCHAATLTQPPMSQKSVCPWEVLKVKNTEKFDLVILVHLNNYCSFRVLSHLIWLLCPTQSSISPHNII